MQWFPCPFCGERPEAEFRFGAEAGHPRPDDSTVDAQTWRAYLYDRANARGPVQEVWQHRSCGEFFLLARDTRTHAVQGARALFDTGTG
jgi:sarcosine oxidase, subunit delta